MRTDSSSRWQSSVTRHGEQEQAWRQYAPLRLQTCQIETGRFRVRRSWPGEELWGFLFFLGVRIGSGCSHNQSNFQLDKAAVLHAVKDMQSLQMSLGTLGRVAIPRKCAYCRVSRRPKRARGCQDLGCILRSIKLANVVRARPTWAVKPEAPGADQLVSSRY